MKNNGKGGKWMVVNRKEKEREGKERDDRRGRGFSEILNFNCHYALQC